MPEPWGDRWSGADVGWDLRVYMDGEVARWSGGPGMTAREVRQAVERRIAEQKLQTHRLEAWLRAWSEQDYLTPAPPLA